MYVLPRLKTSIDCSPPAGPLLVFPRQASPLHMIFPGKKEVGIRLPPKMFPTWIINELESICSQTALFFSIQPFAQQ